MAFEFISTMTDAFGDLFSPLAEAEQETFSLDEMRSAYEAGAKDGLRGGYMFGIIVATLIGGVMLFHESRKRARRDWFVK